MIKLNKMKGHNRIRYEAIVSIIFGTIAILSMVTVFLVLRNPFAKIIDRHPDMQWFIFAFDAMMLMVCSLSIMLIGLSREMLCYFKKERKEVSPE